jgi:hypothetical protein
MPTRKSTSIGAVEDEPEVEDVEDADEDDVPEEEYEVDKVLDHRKDVPVSDQLRLSQYVGQADL